MIHTEHMMNPLMSLIIDDDVVDVDGGGMQTRGWLDVRNISTIKEYTPPPTTSTTIVGFLKGKRALRGGRHD